MKKGKTKMHNYRTGASSSVMYFFYVLVAILLPIFQMKSNWVLHLMIGFPFEFEQLCFDQIHVDIWPETTVLDVREKVAEFLSAEVACFELQNGELSLPDSVTVDKIPNINEHLLQLKINLDSYECKCTKNHFSCLRERLIGEVEYRKCINHCSTLHDDLDLNDYIPKEKHYVEKSIVYQYDVKSPRRHYSQFRHCKGCSYSNGQIISRTTKEEYTTTWTLTNDLMYNSEATNGKIIMFEETEECQYFISRPVFIIPLAYTNNLYHVVIDLLVPLYSTISRGRHPAHTGIEFADSEKPLVFIDAGREGELATFHRTRKRMLDSKCESYYCLVHFFVHNVHSLHTLISQSTDKSICFRDLYVGADLRNVVQPWAFLRDPAQHMMNPLYDLPGSSYQLTCELQSSFNRHLANRLNERFKLPDAQQQAPLKILFIERSLNRKFRDISNLMQITKQLVERYRLQAEISSFAPEKFSFRKQVELYRHVDILVCASGAGCTNLIFLRPNAIVILIMVEGLYGWKHCYGNMAIASGMKILAYKDSKVLHDSQGFEGWRISDNIHGGAGDRDAEFVEIQDEYFRNTMLEALQYNAQFKPASAW